MSDAAVELPLVITDDAVRFAFQSDSDESIEIICGYLSQAMTVDDGIPEAAIVGDIAKKPKGKEIKKVCRTLPISFLNTSNNFRGRLLKNAQR